MRPSFQLQLILVRPIAHFTLVPTTNPSGDLRVARSPTRVDYEYVMPSSIYSSSEPRRPRARDQEERPNSSLPSARPRPPFLRGRGRQRSLPAQALQSHDYSLAGSASTVVLRAADAAGKAAAEQKRISIASLASSGSIETHEDGKDRLSTASPRAVAPLKHEPPEEQSRRRRRWWRVAAELRDTERTYLDVLQTIDELYYQPLLSALPQIDPGAPRRRKRASKRYSMPIWPSDPMAGSSSLGGLDPVPPTWRREGERPLGTRLALSELDIERIFANFADLLALSKLLVEALQGAFANMGFAERADAESASTAPSKLRLGRTLLPLLPFLKQYSLFLGSFSTGLQLLSQLEASPAATSGGGANGVFSELQKQAWRDFTAEAQRRARLDPKQSAALHLNLSGLLLNIVQRLPRYRLLLAELVRLADPQNADAADLQAAYKLVDKVATHANEQIRQHEDDLRILTLQQCFKHLSAPLLTPGRRLLKEATVQMFDQRKASLPPLRQHLLLGVRKRVLPCQGTYYPARDLRK
ncbi:hypothetical protein JCM3774_006184 [Rhodotorula dairenensis]